MFNHIGEPGMSDTVSLITLSFNLESRTLILPRRPWDRDYQTIQYLYFSLNVGSLPDNHRFKKVLIKSYKSWIKSMESITSMDSMKGESI